MNMSMTEMQFESFEQQTGNDLLGDLLSFINEEEEQEIGVNESQPSRIENDMQANYFIRKVKELRKEKEQIFETAERELRRYEVKIEKWKKMMLSPLENKEKFFLQLLQQYAEEQLMGTGKKSMKLIEGTLGFCKKPDKYEYDEKTLLAYLKEKYPDFVRYKASVDKTELKKAAEAKDGKLYLDGEEVPGVAVIPQEIGFDVK